MADRDHAAPGTSDEDRRQHLGLIQAVITRMSAASATAKGWLLPVVTATYGYALTQDDGSVALLGIAAVGLFAMLDANYLRQEQAYRALYDTVARGSRQVPTFTLDPSEADLTTTGPQRSKVLVWIGHWIPGWGVWRSWSIAPFYGGLVVIGLVIAIAE